MSKRAARDQVEAEMAAEREALLEVGSLPTAVRLVMRVAVVCGFCVMMPFAVRVDGVTTSHGVAASH